MLQSLAQIDEWSTLAVSDPPSFLHERHRWVLPAVAYHQANGSLPCPCRLVMFDAHHDSKELTATQLEAIAGVRSRGVTPQSVFDLCINVLSKLNDDWVRAGMELGLYSDAVVFGVEEKWGLDKMSSFTDLSGMPHRIEFPHLPGGEMGFQGGLSDEAAEGSHADLWDILGWQRIEGGVFGLGPVDRRFHLDIDLDCFVVRWHAYHLPWPLEVWEKEFHEESDYFSTLGWTGAGFVRAVLERAGLLTIAREPLFCGGPEKSQKILTDLDHMVFEGRLGVCSS